MKDTSSISQRSPSYVFLQPRVSSNIFSPSLSENRWNQIKTVGNEGIIVQSYGLTGLGLSQTSYSAVGAVLDICVTISVCSRRFNLSRLTWVQTVWDLRDLVPPKCDQFPSILTKQSLKNHMKSQVNL